MTAFGTPVGPVPLVASVMQVVVDPTGKFVYGLARGMALSPTSVWVYGTNPTTGALTAGTQLSAATGTGPSAIAFNLTGTLAYTDSTIGSFYSYSINPASGALGATSSDFNGDGKSDILWRNTTTGANSIWFMNAGVMTSSANLAAIAPASGWNIAGKSDFNGDGKADILWRNTTMGANAIWFMNGGVMASSANLAIIAPASGWTIAK